MKTKTKMPKADLLHIYSWGDSWTLHRDRSTTSLPCVVLHGMSLKQARQRVKFERMSYALNSAAIYKVLVGLTRGELTRAESTDKILDLLAMGHPTPAQQ